MKRHRILLLLFSISFIATTYANEESLSPLDPNTGTLEQKASYAIGVRIGQDLQKRLLPEWDLNIALFLRGIQDALNNQVLGLSDEQMKESISAYKTEMDQKTIEKNQDFLKENAGQEGVKTTDSGLQYKIITAGEGTSPTADDKVKVHYKGSLLNGKEFDSSYKRGRPAEFPVKGVIKGWTEALQLMKPGAKWKLFIPSDLGYGKRGSPPNIPSNSILIFEVELLEVLPKETK